MSRRHPRPPWEPSDAEWEARTVDVICSAKGTHDTIVIRPLQSRVLPDTVEVPDYGSHETTVHVMADTSVKDGRNVHRSFVCPQCHTNLSLSPSNAKRLLDDLVLGRVAKVELLDLIRYARRQ